MLKSKDDVRINELMGPRAYDAISSAHARSTGWTFGGEMEKVSVFPLVEIETIALRKERRGNIDRDKGKKLRRPFGIALLRRSLFLRRAGTFRHRLSSFLLLGVGSSKAIQFSPRAR